MFIRKIQNKEKWSLITCGFLCNRVMACPPKHLQGEAIPDISDFSRIERQFHPFTGTLRSYLVMTREGPQVTIIRRTVTDEYHPPPPHICQNV
ncbi:MAG: hypothetical protein ACE5D1_03385 [Fidelibacterota bacterium]